MKNVTVKCVSFIVFPFIFEQLVYQGNITGILQKQLAELNKQEREAKKLIDESLIYSWG